MNPRDIIFFRDEKFGRHRFYEVQSVCLGGVGQESLIELLSLTETPGINTEGNAVPTTWVPEPLLRGATVYAHPDATQQSDAARVAAEQRAQAAEAALTQLRRVDAFMTDLGRAQ